MSNIETHKATGYIDGQPNDYKTSLYICRQIAQETLNKLR